MSSSWRRDCAGACALIAAAWTLSAADPAAAEDGKAGDQRPITAEEAIENARDAYYSPDEQRVTLCAENAVEDRPGDRAEKRAEDRAADRAADEEADVIVVCRRLGPANPFQTRDGPRARMDQAGDGTPRAPDISTIPPCGSAAGGFGSGMCIGFGWAPPPVLMVDVTKFPEPLSAQDAALVIRAPSGDDPPLPLVTDERVPMEVPGAGDLEQDSPQFG